MMTVLMVLADFAHVGVDFDDSDDGDAEMMMISLTMKMTVRLHWDLRECNRNEERNL